MDASPYSPWTPVLYALRRPGTGTSPGDEEKQDTAVGQKNESSSSHSLFAAQHPIVLPIAPNEDYTNTKWPELLLVVLLILVFNKFL